MKNTQHAQIMEYMMRFGSISPMEAFADLGITKLATRISEMRKDGVPIGKKMEKNKNRFGKDIKYMRYWLVKEAIDG